MGAVVSSRLCVRRSELSVRELAAGHSTVWLVVGGWWLVVGSG